MSEKPILSYRLKSIADMVTKGYTVADVGCDHGFLAIYLVKENISPHVYAMDVKKGPLGNAGMHIQEYGVTDKIDIRLSDGMKQLNIGEAQSLVIAGMGGPLICKLLSDSFDKVKSFKEMILSPQSEIEEFREYLAENNICVIEEKMVKDDDKFYSIFKCRYAPEVENAFSNNIPDSVQKRFGHLLIENKSETFKEFLVNRRRVLNEIEENLKSHVSDKNKDRLKEVISEKEDILVALELMK